MLRETAPFFLLIEHHRDETQWLLVCWTTHEPILLTGGGTPYSKLSPSSIATADLTSGHRNVCVDPLRQSVQSLNGNLSEKSAQSVHPNCSLQARRLRARFFSQQFHPIPLRSAEYSHRGHKLGMVGMPQEGGDYYSRFPGVTESRHDERPAEARAWNTMLPTP